MSNSHQVDSNESDAAKRLADPESDAATQAPRLKGKEQFFQIYALGGQEPEEFDEETASRYREYLAREGLTAEILAERRKWTDLQRRAWEKDDCFDMPTPGSEYDKVLREDADRWLEKMIREGKIAPRSGAATE